MAFEAHRARRLLRTLSVLKTLVAQLIGRRESPAQHGALFLPFVAPTLGQWSSLRPVRWHVADLVGAVLRPKSLFGHRLRQLERWPSTRLRILPANPRALGLATLPPS